MPILPVSTGKELRKCDVDAATRPMRARGVVQSPDRAIVPKSYSTNTQVLLSEPLFKMKVNYLGHKLNPHAEGNPDTHISF